MYGLSGSSMRILLLRGTVLPRCPFTTEAQSVPFNCDQFNASLRPRDSQFIVHVFTIILIFQRFFRNRTTLPKIRCWFVTGRSLYRRLSG